jgi:hypothetical protein
MTTLAEIHLQRGRLIERIAVQRGRLHDGVRPIRRTLEAGDAAIAGLRAGIVYLKQRPWALGLIVATTFALKGRRVFRTMRRVFILWRAWAAMRRSLSEGLRFALLWTA